MRVYTLEERIATARENAAALQRMTDRIRAERADDSRGEDTLEMLRRLPDTAPNRF